MLNKSVFLKVLFLLYFFYIFPVEAQEDNGWDLPIHKIPEFADVRSQLQVLVNVDGFHEVNHFCVVAQKFSYGMDAQVYWPTEDRLIDWEPENNNDSLLMNPNDTNLKTDVVPDNLYPFTQYWTTSEVKAVLLGCQKYGNLYTVYKTEGGWVPISRYKIFSNVRKQLQHLVDTQGHARENHICVIGQKNPYYFAAYVFWPEEKRLIYWLPDPLDPFDEGVFDVEFGDLDLNKGVRDVEDGNKYIYEMPANFVGAILIACKLKGEVFEIEKQRE